MIRMLALVSMLGLVACEDEAPAPIDAAPAVDAAPVPDAAMPEVGPDLARPEAADVPASDVLPADGPAPVSLYNGRDLTGWVWVSADPTISREQVFTADGEVIRCAGMPFGYLRTERTFTSFVLTLKLRHLTAGNGGVFLRVQPPDKIWPRAIEAQGQSGQLGDIWNLDGFPLETDPARTSGPHTARARPDLPERPLGEWNEYRIVLQGESLIIEVNGVVQNEARKVAVLPGHVALQSEGARYEFRDIVLHPLD